MKYEKFTDFEIREAVRLSLSFSDAMRRLGRIPKGTSWAWFKRRVVRSGVDTRHFLGKRAASGRRGRGRAAYLHPEQVLTVWDKPHGTAILRRAFAEHCEKTKTKICCAACGVGVFWNGKPLKLEVHHISQDRMDNCPQNLKWLCPNCHSQEPIDYGRQPPRLSVKQVP